MIDRYAAAAATHRVSFRMLLSVVFSISLIQAQQPALQNVYHRHSVSLNGAWRIIVDPYETGYYNYRYEPSGDGYFADRKPRNSQDLIEYDFDNSPSLNVPGDWNTQKPELFYYEGTIWYRRIFDCDLSSRRRYFLYFGAANYHTIVYLNGEKIGEHVGGFTPFSFEVTGKVRSTGNSVVVKVDNKRVREAVPTVNTDWWNYGGITRDVMLVDVPRSYIDDYSIQLLKGNRITIGGWVRLTGDKKNQAVTISVPEAGITVSGRTNNDGVFFFSTNAKLSLWEPEHPELYDIVIASETDTVRDNIGFRTIETKGQDILLNGKSVFLRGISIHEEAPFRSGRAFSEEDARTLLLWAKELGCNYVRLAHYPHNEHMIRMADQMGLMVWSEIPVYWTITWENSATLANASNQLSEMILRDKNRASIVLWSVANETPVSESRLKFLTALVSRVRLLDSTRLVTAALERHYSDETTQVIDDPLGKYLDVLGCNEYIGWYEGLPDKARRVTWNIAYDKPLIVSEFGGDALYGFHGDSLTRWTEEYQDYLYKEQLALLSRTTQLRGISPWILTDFRSPRRPLPNIQDYFNRKGLISNRGEKKKAFRTLQQYYLSLQKTWKTK